METQKRVRSTSEYEEKNITAFVNSCIEYETNVSFYAVNNAGELASHILLIGTNNQLNEEWVTKLPFYDDNVKLAIEGSSPGKVVGTFTGGRRVCVGVVPEEASRHNCPTRPDAIISLVREALRDGKNVVKMDIFTCSTEEVAIATAVSKAVPSSFSAKDGRAEKDYMANSPTVRVFFPGELKSKAANLVILAKYIQLCMRIVDAPTNLLDTITFTEIVKAYAARLKVGCEIISGEELREQGYGGIYGVGKGAEYPPALVTLTYKPSEMDPQQKIAMVGKGIVYDTGGLAIKTPYTNMYGMKDDMGGAAAVFCGFCACVSIGSKYEMSVTLCIAENAVGPRSQRNDDIIRMKSGLSVEIINTDAEGRLVLADGVYHASKLLPFEPTAIIDMATLTGAQGITTGKYHAALFANNEEIESAAFKAGRKCGDVCYPILYCPEFHNAEYGSTCADLKNLMSAVNNAGSSCGGQFIANNLSKDYKGSFLHIDIAFPAAHDHKATGYGVSLLTQMYASYHI